MKTNLENEEALLISTQELVQGKESFEENTSIVNSIGFELLDVGYRSFQSENHKKFRTSTPANMMTKIGREVLQENLLMNPGQSELENLHSVDIHLMDDRNRNCQDISSFQNDSYFTNPSLEMNSLEEKTRYSDLSSKAIKSDPKKEDQENAFSSTSETFTRKDAEKDDLIKEEIDVTDISTKKICEEVEVTILIESCNDYADDPSLCGSKSSNSDKEISSEKEIFPGDPIINYKNHTSFNSKASIHVANHDEYSHIRLYKSKDQKNGYRITNRRRLKSEILLSNKSQIPKKKTFSTAGGVLERSHSDIFINIIDVVIEDCLCDADRIRNPLYDRETYNLETIIPRIERRHTGPYDPVYIKKDYDWPSLPTRNSGPKSSQNDYKKLRLPNKRISDNIQRISSKRNEEFTIPADGMFGRDTDEPKFVNFCCNTCRMWINLGNRDQHAKNCIKNTMHKVSITALRPQLKPRSIKRMPGVVCFICGKRFMKHTIFRHEKSCLVKWIHMNKSLEKRFRNMMPIKPKFDDGEVMERVNEQIAIGNSDYTAEDAINDIYYKASCKNSINLNN